VKDPHLNLNFGDSYIESDPSDDEHESKEFIQTFEYGKIVGNLEFD
jgi:hypothetical protein